MLKGSVESHQFGSEPGQSSIYLRPPQLLVDLLAPPDAAAGAAGLPLTRSGLGGHPEGVDQFVLDVLQDHGGQGVLAVAVPLHAWVTSAKLSAAE